MKRLKLHQFIIIIITALTLASCSTPKASITGTWTSTSISNPAPFFKNTLPDNRSGLIIFSPAPDGTFTWHHKEEKKIVTGTYTLSGNKLTLEVKDEKPVKTKIHIEGEKMSLLTNDGFTFTFRRSRQ